MYDLIISFPLNMKNKIFKYLVLVFLTTLSSHTTLQAQSLLHEVPLSKKIKISSLLVEGKVIDKHSFWDTDMKHIYTSNTIEIYKVFKGNVISSTVEVFTLGGVVGMEAEKVSPSLQLKKDNIGMFFLKNENIKHNESKKGTVSYMPSAGAQSYYAYNLNEGTAAGIFQKYDDISKTLYGEIYKTTNSDYKEIKEFSVKKKENIVNKAALAITSLTPTSISAGTKSVLTINGSGFGDAKGNVKFRNADTGVFFGTEVLDSQILTWADTKITVEVPDVAGTGKVQVVATGGASFNSANNLTITHAEINVPYENNGVEVAYQVQHVNVDGSGGYIWKMHTDFEANAAANASFVRAMNTWRCSTDIYWEIDGTTEVDEAASDGINIIRFDNDDELPDGTAGRCTSYYGGCIYNAGDNVAWYVAELDIVFDNFDATSNNGTNWEYGPALPSLNEYDFESVAVHELGHGHQLGHVMDSDDFMYRSITNGSSKRVTNENNLDAANDIQSRSIVFNDCGQSPIHSFDCSSLSVEDNLLAANILLFPSYADKEIFISNTSLLSLKEIKFFDVRGLLVKIEALSNSLTQKMDVEQLHAGMYFVQIRSDKGTFSKKVIIK